MPNVNHARFGESVGSYKFGGECFCFFMAPDPLIKSTSLRYSIQNEGTHLGGDVCDFGNDYRCITLQSFTLFE